MQNKIDLFFINNWVKYILTTISLGSNLSLMRKKYVLSCFYTILPFYIFTFFICVRVFFNQIGLLNLSPFNKAYVKNIVVSILGICHIINLSHLQRLQIYRNVTLLL